MILGQFLWVLMAYFVGSIPFGLVIARTCCHIDPRTAGSKSIGATNVSRLCGLPYGIFTLVCDVAKGALPVWGALWLDGSDYPFVSLTAFACVVGHVFSCFLGFRGGKAVAVTIGVFIPLAFQALLGACALCMLVIWRTRFVSLGSMTLAASLPLILIFVDKWQWVPLSVCVAIIIFWRHIDNIKRLLEGTEKPWLKSKHTEQS
ncbi:MAG: glycerol-3-phosphate 1-O-acyltransferase PlsY [Desulfovibrio sp.]|nr:glycerol-3-phosphate 1-O-acyltransferase PlsY [Desulfovibrio sp.]